jgi:hypothetical protein
MDQQADAKQQEHDGSCGQNTEDWWPVMSGKSTEAVRITDSITSAAITMPVPIRSLN